MDQRCNFRDRNSEKRSTVDEVLDDYNHLNVATAKTIEEAQKLIETRFEYVCTYNDIMLFRKPKQTTILKSQTT
ncbi:MAG: hypothetical protein K6T73_01025 [Candidatus Bathyarchaeota archaeon]|nr:hypothetical protein [Candidatus Bathyarchaeota archaeon]